MSQQRLDPQAALSLTAAAACWGFATVITKNLLGAVSPITLLVIQLAFSTSGLWAWLWLTRQRWPTFRDGLMVGMLGLLNPGLSYSLSLVGLTTTTASMSTLLWASEPVLIIGLAGLVLKERLSARLLVWSLVAMGGVLIISGLLTQPLTGGQVLGNGLILSGVACCAVYTVLARRFSETVEPLVAVTLQQTLALLWAAGLWPLERWMTQSIPWSQLDGSTWLWAAVSGGLYYALAFWFYVRGLARTPASLAGAFINLIPVFGVGGAYMFLGERLSFIQWWGAAAIVVAVFAIFLWPSEREAVV